MTEGEKDTVGSGGGHFGSFRSYFSGHTEEAVCAYVDAVLISVQPV